MRERGRKARVAVSDARPLPPAGLRRRAGSGSWTFSTLWPMLFSFHHPNPEDATEVPGGFLSDCKKVGWAVFQEFSFLFMLAQ